MKPSFLTERVKVAVNSLWNAEGRQPLGSAPPGSLPVILSRCSCQTNDPSSCSGPQGVHCPFSFFSVEIPWGKISRLFLSLSGLGFFFFPSLRVAVLSVTQQVLWQGLLHLEGHLQEAPTWAIMRLNGSVSIVLRMMPSTWWGICGQSVWAFPPAFLVVVLYVRLRGSCGD